MLFIAGINSKIKDCGAADSGICPICGVSGRLHIINKYMTPHVFFIPTFRFHSEYIATCGNCASVMALRAEKGRAIKRGEQAEITPADLQVLQDNSTPVCSRCGARLQRGSVFCSQCGEEL